jgi:ubiquinone/menaquinone biosynthesis C-methylase UbiE
MDAPMYHALELQIARDPTDRRRVMPPIRPDHKRILDVGCGAGQTLIASKLANDVEAVGVDPDAEAIAMGRGLDSRIRFILSHAEDMPLPDGHFDLVISRVALPYMSQRAALAEMARVLRPGGEVWFTLHSLDVLLRETHQCLRRGELRGALHRAYVIANGALLHLTGLEFPSPRNGRYESFQTERGIRRSLQRAGFGSIRVERSPFFTVSAVKAR